MLPTEVYIVVFIARAQVFSSNQVAVKFLVRDKY